MSLEGKVVVVTGGGRGIGRALVHLAAARGARVATCARSRDELEETRAGVDGELFVQLADLSDPGQTEDFIQAATEALGPVDVLINNAGTLHRAPVAGHSSEDWDRVLEVNLTAPFRLCRAVLPSMIERGAGRIVNVSSISGTLGTPQLSSYCASKWGLIGFTKSLAEEVKEQGIVVTAVCPGSVDTRMLRDGGVPGLTPDMTPEDVAGLILYYADEAPPAVTGAAVEIFG